MSLFLTILEGPSPSEARPILATQDQEAIEAVARRLLLRLTVPRRVGRLAAKRERPEQ